MKEASDRYFIVGTGRSGSTLMASFLADAGADFGMPVNASWDRSSGDLEHPGIHSAYRNYVRARKIAESFLPDFPLKYFFEWRMKSYLNSTLNSTMYVKSSTLVWLVHPAFMLGWRPKIIAVYRSFPDYCMSRYLRSRWRLSRLVDTYVSVNSTALLQLSLFGGCAVSYEELTDIQETDWASAVVKVTGIDEGKILSAREKRLKPARYTRPPLVADDEAEEVYMKLRRLKGTVIGGSIKFEGSKDE